MLNFEKNKIVVIKTIFEYFLNSMSLTFIYGKMLESSLVTFYQTLLIKSVPSIQLWKSFLM